MERTDRWRVVPGYGERYLVGERGAISRKVMASAWPGDPATAMWLPPYKGRRKGDVVYVHMSNGTETGRADRRLREVVAEAFLPPCPEEGWELAHVDGDPGNCAAENLEWRPPKERNIPRRPVDAWRGGKVARTFPSLKEAGEAMGCSPSTIWLACHSARESQGYVWRYVGAEPPSWTPPEPLATDPREEAPLPEAAPADLVPGAPEAQGRETEWLTIPELSAMLGISATTLHNMRADGTGPAFLRLGKTAIRYSKAAVLAWIDASLTTKNG